MTYTQFRNSITEDSQILSTEELAYIRYHCWRLYVTYLECIRYLSQGDRVLSYGVGCGALEKMLVKWGAVVELVDFQVTVDHYSSYYKHIGITQAHALEKGVPTGDFSLLIFSEVIEHVNQAPSEIFKMFKPIARKIIVTTPNLGSIGTIIKLLLMRPILPPPSYTFGPVSYTTQETHRREYLPREMKEEMKAAGYNPQKTKFFFYTDIKKMLPMIFRAFGIIPRFRPGMMIVGVQ